MSKSEESEQTEPNPKAKEEVLPWEALRGIQTVSLRKIARVLSSALIDEEGSPLGPAWGAAGMALSKEINAFCDWSEGQKERRDTRREKAGAKRLGDPRYEEARGVIHIFVTKGEEVLGAKPVVNWGYALKQVYQLMDGGWEVPVLEDLVAFFYAKRLSGALFRDGSFTSFFHAIPRLKALWDAESQGLGDEKVEKKTVFL